jgi:hypothetical protein
MCGTAAPTTGDAWVDGGESLGGSDDGDSVGEGDDDGW